jgi:hypothetical protein
MCVVSMVTEHYIDKWRLYPTITPITPWVPNTLPNTPNSWPPYDKDRDNPLPVIIAPPIAPVPQISPEEVAEFRRLLDRAREYDKKNNEPECEMTEKVALLQKIAAALGVDLSDL